MGGKAWVAHCVRAWSAGAGIAFLSRCPNISMRRSAFSFVHRICQLLSWESQSCGIHRVAFMNCPLAKPVGCGTDESDCTCCDEDRTHSKMRSDCTTHQWSDYLAGILRGLGIAQDFPELTLRNAMSNNLRDGRQEPCQGHTKQEAQNAKLPPCP